MSEILSQNATENALKSASKLESSGTKDNNLHKELIEEKDNELMRQSIAAELDRILEHEENEIIDYRPKRNNVEGILHYYHTYFAKMSNPFFIFIAIFITSQIATSNLAIWTGILPIIFLGIINSTHPYIFWEFQSSKHKIAKKYSDFVYKRIFPMTINLKVLTIITVSSVIVGYISLFGVNYLNSTYGLKLGGFLGINFGFWQYYTANETASYFFNIPLFFMLYSKIKERFARPRD